MSINRKTTILLYSISFLFIIYIFVLYIIIGANHAPVIQAKLALSKPIFQLWSVCFLFHLILGIISLVLSVFQLTDKSQSNLATHRKMGKWYVNSIFLNIFFAGFLSFFATGGISSTITFLFLTFCWLFTTALGVYFIGKRNVEKHKKWMLRSIAITWVFVSFRFVLIPLSLIWKPEISFPLAVLFSIFINLLIIELIRKRTQFVAS